MLLIYQAFSSKQVFWRVLSVWKLKVMSLPVLSDNLARARRMYSAAELWFTFGLKFLALSCLFLVCCCCFYQIAVQSKRSVAKTRSLIGYKSLQTSKMGTKAKQHILGSSSLNVHNPCLFFVQNNLAEYLMRGLKMIGILLNVIHGQVKKSLQNHTTKTFNGIHNHCTLLTTVQPHESPRGNKPTIC